MAPRLLSTGTPPMLLAAMPPEFGVVTNGYLPAQNLQGLSRQIVNTHLLVVAIQAPAPSQKMS